MTIRLVRALLLFVLALLSGWLGGTADAVLTPLSAAHVYTYDGVRLPDTVAGVSTARGSPTATDDLTYDIVDGWSHGASVRSGVCTAGATTTDAAPARLIKVLEATGTCGEQAQLRDGRSVFFGRAGVAAKTETSLVKYEEWPSNNGFFGGFEKDTVLQPGTRIDRYGSNRGSFVSPEGTPFKNRGLPGSRAGDPYSSFTVQKPITVRGGIAAPWMDSPGGGVQYLLPRSVQELLDGGFLG